MPDPESEKKKLTKAERRQIQEAQRAAKAAKENEKSTVKQVSLKEDIKPPEQTLSSLPEETGKEKKLSKAERRKIQEDQRAAKANKQAPSGKIDQGDKPIPNNNNMKKELFPETNSNINDIYLFQHLQSLLKDFKTDEIDKNFYECFKHLVDKNCEDTEFCIDFIHATREFLIKEFATDDCLSRNFMNKLVENLDIIYVTEMLPITVQSFLKYLKLKSSEIQINSASGVFKNNLAEYLEEFEREMIVLAGEAISERASEYIKDGENVAIYGNSTLIKKALLKAKDRNVLFSVLVVDSFPFFEGRNMLKDLIKHEIPCQYCMINSFSSNAHEISVLLLGCSGLLTNGNVLAPMGSNLLAGCIIGQKPVIVCSETFKFWDLAQTDIFEFNEILPHDLMIHEKTPKQNANLKVLNLKHDVIQPSNVTAIVTEIATLPTSSVPVILRVKQC